MVRGVISDANLKRDKNGISYARKEMIICRLELCMDGISEEKKLSLSLQGICAQYCDNLVGKVLLSYKSDIFHVNFVTLRNLDHIILIKWQFNLDSELNWSRVFIEWYSKTGVRN